VLTKRIIPCLDIKNGRTVKGTNFQNLRDAGDAIELARWYSENSADELVFLDISATNEKRKTIASFANKVAKEISIPFTIGGGITSVEDAEILFKNGADKIAINTAAIQNPVLIQNIANKFGSQAVVIAIDAKMNAKKQWNTYSNSGTIDSKMNVIEWIKKIEKLGAGEILLTSIDKDGTRKGFDLELYKTIRNMAKIPIIASGGAGNTRHFLELFKKDLADAALAASIFHNGEIMNDEFF